MSRSVKLRPEIHPSNVFGERNALEHVCRRLIIIPVVKRPYGISWQNSNAKCVPRLNELNFNYAIQHGDPASKPPSIWPLGSLVYERPFGVLIVLIFPPFVYQLLVIAMLLITPVTIEHVTIFSPRSIISPLQKQGLKIETQILRARFVCHYAARTCKIVVVDCCCFFFFKAAAQNK